MDIIDKIMEKKEIIVVVAAIIIIVVFGPSIVEKAKNLLGKLKGGN